MADLPFPMTDSDIAAPDIERAARYIGAPG